jgi:hypothetical protein
VRIEAGQDWLFVSLRRAADNGQQGIAALIGNSKVVI